jgi:GDP/UDP-N,N'-diacetylbacillosamine 2-epimerase (hydrolysing)
MSSKLKICVVTGTRAEYGLFMPLLNLLKNDTQFNLQLLVTGMHLSPEFGLTYKEIEAAGYAIDEKVEILLSSDTHTGTTKSTGLAMIGFADSYQRLKPDWVVVLGDRFETFAAATAAYLAKIPILHLHGGETTEGATDEALRHAISKMSYLHFTSAENHRKRVIQLGEEPERVFNVGAIGLDNIVSLNLLSKKDLAISLDFPLDKPYMLVTFHPVTLENNTAEQQFQILLQALDYFKDMIIIFTLPNADADGRIIIKCINEYVSTHPLSARAFTSLGQLRYLSTIKHSALVVGNSSSGLIEVPSFNVPTVNVGDRQKGRLSGETVINADIQTESIIAAIEKSLSVDFKEKCKTAINPYGNGATAQKIMEILKSHPAIKSLKKPFFDL